MGEPDQGDDIGRYAGWGTDKDANQPPDRVRVERRGIFRFVAEDTRRDKLTLLLLPCWIVVLTIWEWLNHRFGVPAWVGWAAMAVVAVIFVALSLPRRVRR